MAQCSKEKEDLEMKVIHIPGDVTAFTATNVLTAAECAACIAAEAAEFKWSGKCGGPRFAGQRVRTTYTDTKLAAHFFERLSPVLSSSSFQ
jgi:hypothetical protein